MKRDLLLSQDTYPHSIEVLSSDSSLQINTTNQGQEFKNTNYIHLTRNIMLLF